MGRNSRQRHAAKQRKRSRQGSGHPGRPLGHEDGWPGAGDRGFGSDFYAGPDPVAFADLMLVRAVRRLSPGATAAEGRECAESALRTIHPVEGRYAARAMRDVLDRVLEPALRAGWGPADLIEAVTRKVGGGHGGELAWMLAEARRRGVAPASAAWDADLEELGAAREVDLRGVEGLGLALRLAALIAALPADGAAPAGTRRPVTVGGKSGAKLAQVRALLAKAESTEFPEEAEALAAKAQEMIARYSLERLLETSSGEPTDAGSAVALRRLWLDAPYVSAKANLVNEVASANRSRAVFHQGLGLCTVVGSSFDLDATELLVTSLLVQAERAMLAHGRVADARGTSRTRSFRQSFMVSFAHHIGERLRAATEESLRASGDQADLLPAVVSHEERVESATEQLFPNLVAKAVTVSNAAGWAGGRAAAELALLDVYGRLDPERSPIRAAPRLDPDSRSTA